MATPVVSLPVPEVVGTWTTKKLILIEHLNKGQWRYLTQPQETRSKVGEESFMALVYLLDVCICVNMYACLMWMASQVALVVKTTCQCRSRGFDPWVGKIPWRKTRQPTPNPCNPSILAWRFPGTEEPSGLWSIGSQSQTPLKQLSTHMLDVYDCVCINMWGTGLIPVLD